MDPSLDPGTTTNQDKSAMMPLHVLFACSLVVATHASRFPGDNQAMEGTVFPLSVPAATAAMLLPAGLELAPLPNATGSLALVQPGQHIILFTFCLQENVGAPFTKVPCAHRHRRH